MTDLDLAELERLAEEAQEAIRLHGGLVPTSIYKFQDAADPATIIRLVARLREAEARVERFDAVGAYAVLREELSRERRAHTVTLQRLRKAEARIEKVSAERDEAREAAENNVLNAEATYERMDEKLRKVTAERDFFASELSVAEHTSALRYYRAEKAEAERDNAEKQAQIRAEDSIAARVARQNVRAVEEYARLVTERDQLAAVIREALGVARSGSVPLGVQEARHFDRLLAETRRALNEAPPVALDRVKAEAWDEGVARAETHGAEAAFDENPYRREQA